MTKKKERKRGPQYDTQIRLRAIASIIEKYGTTSPTEILNLLKEEHGIITTRQTVTADLKKDLDALDDTELKNQKTTILSTIKELAEIAEKISKNPNEDSRVRLTAMNTYSQMVKTQAEVLKKLQEAKVELSQAERPVHHIHIGRPKMVTKEELANEEKIKEDADTDDAGVKE